MADALDDKIVHQNNCGLLIDLHHKDELPLHKNKLELLSADGLVAWGFEHATELEYRVELARRIAEAFGDADTLLMFDDIDLVLTESDRTTFIAARGCDRSLLPALWFSTGFRYGGIVIVYAPPNPVEMKNYVELKMLMEERLQQRVPIQILYESEEGILLDLLKLFVQHPIDYTAICERFAQRPVSEFCSEFHINLIKKHFDTITKDSKRIFVFPYEMSPIHKQRLEPHMSKIFLPDIPSMDKAKHHFILQSHGYRDMPFMLAVSSDGKIINDYESYHEAVQRLSLCQVEKTLDNIETFARGIIHAIDRIRNDLHLAAFVKLDAKGAGGWSSVTPELHTLVYDSMGVENERVAYLTKYMNENVTDQVLPSIAVIEEFVQPEKRPGYVDADYAIAGFVLDGKFFPSSVNLMSTNNGRYIGMWTSPKPNDILDPLISWQKMFSSSAQMVMTEGPQLSYMNGIYATDLFITVEGHIKQRDWNIRRGGRSAPETLAMFGIPIYETSVVVYLNDFGDFDLTHVQLFRVYTNVCEQLVNEHSMYVFSSAYGYCGKDYNNGSNTRDLFKFDVLIHTNRLVDENGQTLSKCNHHQKVTEIIRGTISQILSKIQ